MQTHIRHSIKHCKNHSKILIMKFFILPLALLVVFQGMAQSPKTPQDSLKGNQELIIISSPKTVLQDSSRIIILKDSTIKEPESTVSELFIIGKNAYKRGRNTQNNRYPAFKGHWSGFSYGFVNFANTDYSMYKGTEFEKFGEFMELDWSHSFSMQFNIFKHSINLVPRNNFGIVWGLGLEYQRLRFENNYISVMLENNRLVPRDLHDEEKFTDIKRSTFKTLYLTIPLVLELQLPANNKHRFYVSGGVMGGLRMHSKTKIVYNNQDGEKRKQKGKSNFNMIPFKADVVGRVGYRCLNVWGSYTLTRMFKSGKGPELHPYTIGLGYAF